MLQLGLNYDAAGAAFLMVLGVVVGISHIMAARQPARNALTRLLHDYYGHRWPLQASLESRQAMLLVGFGGILCAVFGCGGLIYELTK